MKKTLIALMALAGVAVGAVESGSYTLKTDQWTTGDSTLYDYLNGVFNEGGTLTFDLVVSYTGSNCNAYQALLHVGAVDTGFSIYANGGPHVIVSEKHDTSDVHELQATGAEFAAKENNTLTVTLTGIAKGTAAVSFTLNGVEYANDTVNEKGQKDVLDLTWDSMNWSTTEAERNKYSVNCKAPGYGSAQVAQSTRLVSGSATYTAIPEPTTATLSLLALAGLAVRRRRK